jgi:predicted TIM-barrel enzyme
VWADVFVKHAAPPPGRTLEQAASDTWERAGADALVVSGEGTGRAPDLASVARIRETVADAPIVVGSGATPENLAELAEIADHIIVGTALEQGGRPGGPLDPARVERFAAAAARAGLL